MERLHKDWLEIVKAVGENSPVIVENAIIEVSTDLRHGTVARELRLVNCVVRGLLTASNVTFMESVSFVDTVFEDGIDLSGCTFNGYLIAHNVEIRSAAEFEGVSVSGHARFDNCTFKAQPNFTTASFGMYTSYENSTFESGAVFYCATFAGHLFISGIKKCVGDFDCTWVAVGGLVGVSNSVFGGTLKFTEARVGRTMGITDTAFGTDASLEFERISVGEQLVIQNCNFDNEKGQCVLMAHSVISGGCRLQNINCKGDFNMDGATILRGLTIGEYATSEDLAMRRDVVFAGEFSIRSITVDGNFWCSQTNFEGKGGSSAAGFADMAITGQTYIFRCAFKAGADFNRAAIRGVFGTNAIFEKEVTFEGSKFEKGVRFRAGCEFRGGAIFYFAEFREEVNFGGAKIAKVLNLKYVQFSHSLLFSFKGSEDHPQDVVVFDDAPGAGVVVELHGCSYAGLILPYNFSDIQSFINRVPANDSTSFIYLERYLRRSGRPKQADCVRVHWNSAEGLRMRPYQPSWWINRLHRYTTRYGTVIAPFFVFAVLLAVFGQAVEYIPQLHLAARTVQNVSWAVAGFGIALITDVARRRLWPSESQ